MRRRPAAAARSPILTMLALLASGGGDNHSSEVLVNESGIRYAAGRRVRRARSRIPHHVILVSSSKITDPDIFEVPRTRSRNVMGTSAMCSPCWTTR